jgi:hypothetical protein
LRHIEAKGGSSKTAFLQTLMEIDAYKRRYHGHYFMSSGSSQVIREIIHDDEMFLFVNDCKSFRIPKLTSETITEVEGWQKRKSTFLVVSNFICKFSESESNTNAEDFEVSMKRF